MPVTDGRKAAQDLIATIPGLMQAVMSEMRQCEEPMRFQHFRALMLIGATGTSTLTDLAARQHVSLPTMSNTVSVLVDRGWVDRVPDEDDRRRIVLCLTPAGVEVTGRMYERVQTLLEERMSELTSAELDDVRAGFAALRRVFGSGHGVRHAGGEAE